MASTWPAKNNYATGDVLTAANMNGIGDDLNDVYNFSGYAAGKNKIINGDFGIWQRGTSFTGIGSDVYFADRFVSNGTGNNYSQQTFTAGTAPVAGYEGQYFARASVTGTGSTQIGMAHKVEDVRTFAGQTVTFSFWAKADSARTASLLFQQNFGSGGSSSVYSAGSTQAITTSWARYSVTYTFPSIAGKTLGAGSFIAAFLYLAPGQASGSVALDTWGWQLEAGSTASIFQTATGTKQGELAACQRYYFRANGNGSLYGNTSIGGGNSTTAYWGDTYFPVAMRTAPTAIDYATLSNYRIYTYADGLGATPTAVSLDTNITTNTVGRTLWTGTGFVATTTYYTRGNGTASSYLGFSAEL